MSEDDKLKDAVRAVEGIVRAVPIYQDVVQPAAQEVGKALQTVTKSIHVAIAPIAALVWGYEQIRDFVSTRVAEKLQHVPPENIQTPDATVVGPALEALKYAGSVESLREMYANLLAASLDKSTASDAHPSFVDIIKSLSSDEAKIMRLFITSSSYPVVDVLARQNVGLVYRPAFSNFSFIGREAGCQLPLRTPSYLDNLSRLGLLEIPSGKSISGDNVYEPIETDPELASVKAQIGEMPNTHVDFERKVVTITNFGRQFCRACVIEKSVQAV
ncbi:MAG: DUF4393 domain-containing protein [Bacteroidota bacterium]